MSVKKHTEARLEDAIIDHLSEYRSALITAATTGRIDGARGEDTRAKL